MPQYIAGDRLYYVLGQLTAVGSDPFPFFRYLVHTFVLDYFVVASPAVVTLYADLRAWVAYCSAGRQRY